MSKKVFVYTIPRPTATKVSEIVNHRNVKLNQTKITRGCKDTRQALLSEKTGKLSTGLAIMVDNPYKDDKSLPVGFEGLAGKEKVKLQHIKEIEHGVPFDYYTDEPFNRANPRKKEPTFFQTFKFGINDGMTVFDLGKRDDELAYYVMLASKFFANSKRAWEERKYPDAVYYISEQEESDDLKYEKRQQRDKATALLSVGKLSDNETQRKLLKILLPKESKGELRAQKVYNLLSSAIDSNERDFTGLTFIERFNKVISLLDHPKGKEEFEARAFLQDLINNWIVSEKNGSFQWKSKDMSIGATKEKALQFITDPDKQEYYDALVDELRAKTAI